MYRAVRGLTVRSEKLAISYSLVYPIKVTINKQINAKGAMILPFAVSKANRYRAYWSSIELVHKVLLTGPYRYTDILSVLVRDPYLAVCTMHTVRY
ncbi:hypothetical protein BHE74_00057237 [Ensete ventricosum]|nr:hypothetical protein BHE74_00057237 [Ensete ventricosum]